MKRSAIVVAFTLTLGVALGAVGIRYLDAQQPALKRTDLLRAGMAEMDGKEAHIWVADIAPGAATGGHRHPTTRFVYVVEGAVTLEIEGQPPRTYQAGEAFAERPDAEWVTGRCRIIDGAGREIRRGATAYKNVLLRRYSRSLYLTQNFISAPSTFARREAYVRHPFREDYALAMDYDVFLQLAKRGDPVVLDRDLACFRMVEGTLSMSSFERQFAEHAAMARAHGDGHPAPVALNQVMSRLIVLVYRTLRAARGLRRSPAS
jgi:hypothetical protein